MARVAAAPAESPTASWINATAGSSMLAFPIVCVMQQLGPPIVLQLVPHDASQCCENGDLPPVQEDIMTLD